MDALILKLHSFYIAQWSPGTQRKIGIDHCNPGATESGYALPLQTGSALFVIQYMNFY